MKKYIDYQVISVILIIFYCIFFSQKISAQIPNGVNYQAVARNNSGNILPNKSIGIQFSILENSSTGNAVYIERHQTVTNNLGLFTLILGKGSGVLGNFSGINWKTGDKFLKVEIDPAGSNNYINFGTTQLLSVPYALVAQKSIEGDNWGNQFVKTDNTLIGNGTDISPLKISQQTATLGQVLKWNGATWSPSNDDVNFGSALITSPRISGNGTINSPLDIAGMNAKNGQALIWNGTFWGPADINSTVIGINSNYPINITKINNEYSIGLSNGVNNNDMLVWENNRWVIKQIQINNLVAGMGIEIINNQINTTTWKVNGSNVYRNIGFVGIGTDIPRSPLEIKSNSNLDFPNFRIYEDDRDFARLNFENNSSQNYWSLIGRPAGGGSAGRLNFFYSEGLQDIMSLTDEGIVGIGTVDPENTTRLDIFSNRKYAGLFSSNLIDDNTTVVNAFFDATGQVDAVAVAGTCEAAPGKGFGAQFYGGNTGVMGVANAGNFSGSYAAIGVYGESNDDQNEKPRGTRIGVYGFGKGGDYNMGVYGGHNKSGNYNYAGYFEGTVNVVGLLQKSGGSFKIDHPVDPANKYLYHSFVESPDMMNIYNGNITTGEKQIAVIELPNYFEALNKDFRYQLTVIGDDANAYILDEIQNNKFRIKTSKPNIKVSWQITGIRKDPFAEKNRIEAEVSKKGPEIGKYLHPDVYNLPENFGIGYQLKPSQVVKREIPKRKNSHSKLNSNGNTQIPEEKINNKKQNDRD